MHYGLNFEEVIEKGSQIEKVLIAKGMLKIVIKNKHEAKSTYKSKLFNKNKHVVGDGITNSKRFQAIQIGPLLKLSQGPRPKAPTKCAFASLIESLSTILKQLDGVKMVEYPTATIPYKEDSPKPVWFKDNEYCDFHRVKGHETDRCFRLCHYIRDLIEEGKIIVDSHPESGKGPNEKMGIYKEPFPNHADKK